MQKYAEMARNEFGFYICEQCVVWRVQHFFHFNGFVDLHLSNKVNGYKFSAFHSGCVSFKYKPPFWWGTLRILSKMVYMCMGMCDVCLMEGCMGRVRHPAQKQRYEEWDVGCMVGGYV